MLDAEAALARARRAAGVAARSPPPATRRLRRAELGGAPRRAATRSCRSSPRCGSGRRGRRAVRAPRRDEPGHHRHGGDAHRRASARAAREDLAGAAEHGRRARAGAPLDADGRPHAAPAGAADHVRARRRRAGWRRSTPRSSARRALTPPAQLGGPAGTLAGLGPTRSRARRARSTSTRRCCRGTPRAPVAALAAALGRGRGAVGRSAGDVVLLAQTEVGEVARGGGAAAPRRCRTSTTRSRRSRRAPRAARRPASSRR